MSQTAVQGGVIICFAIAYNLLAFSINQFGINNQPEEYKFPQYSGLWMTALGMGIWLFIESFVDTVFRDSIRKNTVKKANPQTTKTAVNNAMHFIYSYIFYLLAVAWGWFSLYDTLWLPSLLGGKDGAGPVAAMRRYPFIP